MKYFMACRIESKILICPSELGELVRKLQHKLQDMVPAATLTSCHALLGPYDLLYLVEAPDNATAMKVAIAARSLGIAHSEIWPAIEGADFEALAAELSADAQKCESKINEALEESFPASDAPPWTGTTIG